MKDPNDIHLWKLKSGDKILGQVLQCIPRKRSQKATHYALNGAVYIQQLGAGSQILELKLFVESQEDLLEIDRNNCTGGLLSVYYKGVLYVGVIDGEMPEVEEQEKGRNYIATINFIVTNAVEDFFR